MSNRPRLAAAAAACALLVVATTTACIGRNEPVVTVTATETQTVTETLLPDVGEVIDEVTDPFTMPNLVGDNLQQAQDALQALGSFFMDQQDASGEGRLQIDDSNWKVCSQEPAPGTTASKADVIVLAVVKNDEDCP